MSTLDLLKILEEQHFEKTDEFNEGYNLYVKDSIRLWVGGYFIENENCPHAFPYKEENNLKELLQFINAEK